MLRKVHVLPYCICLFHFGSIINMAVVLEYSSTQPPNQKRRRKNLKQETVVDPEPIMESKADDVDGWWWRRRWWWWRWWRWCQATNVTNVQIFDGLWEQSICNCSTESNDSSLPLRPGDPWMTGLHGHMEKLLTDDARRHIISGNVFRVL